MSSRTSYCLPDPNEGFDSCNILTEHFGRSGMRTILLSKFDFGTLQPWKLVSLLNEAYAQGQRDFKEDFKSFIGVE